jgi:hypothetical protein
MGHGFRFLLPPFLYYPSFFKIFRNKHSFFKIFIIIRFSSFDNISRRHTSRIIRAFCVHSFSTDTYISRKTVDTEYTYYSKLWTQNTRIILNCGHRIHVLF